MGTSCRTSPSARSLSIPPASLSNTTNTYLIAGGVGVVSVALWAWLIAVPAFTAYQRWWQRIAAVVMSVYVLAAMVAMGGLIGAIFLWYYDEIG